MHSYLRFLSGLYFVGGTLHALDLLSFRLNFSGLSVGWQVWVVYLMVADFLASIGLWMRKKWGIALFVLIATSQLVAYIGFKTYFGDQTFLVTFHVITLLFYFFLKNRTTTPHT